MEPSQQPRIVFAERLHNAVIIVFDNGRTGVYSAALLYATFSSAEDITHLDDEPQIDA